MTAIRVELELQDGQFVTRMLRAGQTVQQLTSHINGQVTTLREADRHWSSFGGTIQRAVVGLGVATAAFGVARLASVDMVGGIIRVNAEFERMHVLLKGMSTAADPMKDATAQVKYLRDFATQAPFALKTLSDVFVRLKAGGIDPTTGSMKALVNAVAAAGGTGEQLNRASVAIQQMSGKSVIQMEELRQQIGEAIPRATELLARSAGMSIGELSSKIATGTVSAKENLARLFDEFHRVFGGAAQAQMNTFNGLVAQIQSSFQDLAKKVGDTDFFAEVKKQLRDFNMLLQSGRGMELAGMFGAGMAQTLQAFRAIIDTVITFREEIKVAGMAMLAAFGASQFVGTLANLGGRFAMFSVQMELARRKADDFGQSMGLAAARSNMLAGAQVGVAMAAARTAMVFQTVLATATAFGGWIIVGIGLLAALGASFDIMGTKATKAWEAVRKRGQILDDEELGTLRESLKKDEAALAKFQLTNGNRRTSRVASDRTDYDSEVERREKDLAQKRMDLKDFEARYSSQLQRRQADDQMALVEEGILKERGAYDKRRADREREMAVDIATAAKAGKSTEALRAKAADEQKKESIALHELIIRRYDDEDARIAKRMETETEAARKISEITRQRLAAARNLENEVLERTRATDVGLTMTGNDGDFEQKFKRGEAAVGKMRAEIEGLKAELTGASGEYAKLAYQLANARYGPQDSDRVKLLIEDLLKAQTEVDNLKAKIEGQSALERELRSAALELAEREFKLRNDGRDMTRGEKIDEMAKLGFFDPNVAKINAGTNAVSRFLDQANQTASVFREGVAGALGATADQIQKQTFGPPTIKAGENTAGVIETIIAKMNQLKGIASGGWLQQSLTVDPVTGLPMGGAGMPPVFGSNTAPADKNGVQQMIVDFFRNAGLGPTGIAAILGTVKQESGFNPNAVNSIGASGLFQHLYDRKNGLMAATGGNLGNVMAQLSFVMKEFQTTEKSKWDRLVAADRAGDAAGASKAMLDFERPANPRTQAAEYAREFQIRSANAAGFMPLLTGMGRLAGAIDTTAAKVEAGGQKVEAGANGMTAGAQQMTRELTAGEKDLKIREERKELTDYVSKFKDELSLSADELMGVGPTMKKFRAAIFSGERTIGGNRNPDDKIYDEWRAKILEIDKKLAAKEDQKKADGEAKTASKNIDARLENLGEQGKEAMAQLNDPFGLKKSGAYFELLRMFDKARDAMVARYGEGSAQVVELDRKKADAIARLSGTQTLKAAAGWEERTREINRSLMTEGQSREAAAAEEVQRIQRQVAEFQGSEQEKIAIVERASKAIAAIRAQAAASSPVAKELNEWRDMSGGLEQATVGWMNGAADAFANFVTTGKLDFKSLAQSMIADIARIGFKKLVASLFGGENGQGGIMSWLTGGGVTTAAQTTATAIQGAASKITGTMQNVASQATGIGGKKGGGAKGAGGKGGGAKKLATAGVMHTGGIAGVAGGSSRMVSAAMFAGARRYHTGGMAGKLALAPGQTPIIGQDGEFHVSRDQLSALRAGRPFMASRLHAKNGAVALSKAMRAQLGLAGDEIPMFAGRGDAIMTDKQMRGLLGGAPRFHTGGVLGAPGERLAKLDRGMSPARAAQIADAKQVNNVTIAPAITVNANGGTPEQNQDLARKIAKESEGSIRGIVASELRVQLRAGNMLNRGAR